MGYIGLLLNAPYKIDSMVWMRCRLVSFIFLDVGRSLWERGINEPEIKKAFLGVTLVLGILGI
jgi:hypothetical protein